jgi:hypothetical protein
MARLNELVPRLRVVGGHRVPNIKMSVDQAVLALAALSGGQPRCLETVMWAVVGADPALLATVGSAPLMTIAKHAAYRIAMRYSKVSGSYMRALQLCIFAAELDRTDVINLLENSEETVDNALSSGVLFSTSCKFDESNKVRVSFPLIIAIGLDCFSSLSLLIAEFRTTNFEAFIAYWLQLWSESRYHVFNSILKNAESKYGADVGKKLWIIVIYYGTLFLLF